MKALAALFVDDLGVMLKASLRWLRHYHYRAPDIVIDALCISLPLTAGIMLSEALSTC